MVSMNQIEKFGREIGSEFHADRVLLIGSCADGSATEDSDVDLLVVMGHDGKGWRMASKIRGKLRQ